MSGNRKQVAANALYVDRNFPRRLYCVRMEVHIGFGGDFADPFDRLQDSGFIVGQHDGDEPGVWPQGATNIVRINQALAVDRNIGDFAVGCRQMLAGIQHRMMLDG